MSSVAVDTPSTVGAAAKTNRLAFVDSLRGLAVLGVIMAHVAHMLPGLPSIAVWYAFRGSMGVQLFYVASAFTLFLSLRNRKGSEQRTVHNFFIRRFFRIAPLFYTSMIVYVLWDVIRTRGFALQDITPGSIAATLFFFHGLTPYWINRVVPGGWSIAVEMMFYLMVPFLFARIRKVTTAIWWTVVVLLLSGPVSLWAHGFLVKYYSADLTRDYVYFWLPRQLCVFGLGIILYHLFTAYEATSSVTSSSHSKKWIAGCLMAVFFFLLVAFYYVRGNLVIPQHFLYGIAFVLLALSLARHANWFFVNRVTCYIGTVSYSCYITHFAVMRVAEKVLEPLGILHCSGLTSVACLFLIYVVFVVVTVGVSTLTYRFIELPGQALGRRLIIAGEKKLR